MHQSVKVMRPRLRHVSTITMAASIIAPLAMAMPPRLMIFPPMPSARIAVNAIKRMRRQVSGCGRTQNTSAASEALKSGLHEGTISTN